MTKAFTGKLEKIDDYRWRIPKTGSMRVPGVIYSDEHLLKDIRMDQSPKQVANVAHLPGIIDYSLAMPDMYWGYGFPIGGVLTTDEISRGFSYGDHGTTFGGNPLACSVAETVVTTIINKELIDNARKQGMHLLTRLEKIARKLPITKEVRGMGLMVGIELEIPCRPIMIKLLERGFLVNCTAEKTIRLLPPLIVRKREIDSLIKNLYRILSREKM